MIVCIWIWCVCALGLLRFGLIRMTSNVVYVLPFPSFHLMRSMWPVTSQHTLLSLLSQLHCDMHSVEERESFSFVWWHRFWMHWWNDCALFSLDVVRYCFCCCLLLLFLVVCLLILHFVVFDIWICKYDVTKLAIYHMRFIFLSQKFKSRECVPLW